MGFLLKHIMKPRLLLIALAFGAITLSVHGRSIPQPKKTKAQIAILLDTSSSMNGLIHQAKSQLWKIVNSIPETEQGKQVESIEVALYEYGNANLSVANHWIRQVTPLTKDLDEVSKQLFRLSTSGGDEYCGTVIDEALTSLEWDPSPQTYKVIFIAGNEAFTQGQIDPATACRKALSKGVTVNTIHCGDSLTGINGGWKTGALAAEGQFLNIDQDKKVAHVEAPQDKIIIELSAKLNKTYYGYHKNGSKKIKRQLEEDLAAEQLKQEGAALNRAITKSSQSLYNNAHWDLLDACKDDYEALKTAEESFLPKEIQGKTLDEKKKWIQASQTKRKKIQTQIQSLNKERSEWLRKNKSEAKTDETLDKAIIKTLQMQLKK